MLSGGFWLHICLINVSSYMQVAHIYEFKIRMYAVISTYMDEDSILRWVI